VPIASTGAVCRLDARIPARLATAGRGAVIAVTRFDGQTLFVNADLIESIEQTPDTIISFTSGRKMLVRDHPDELARRVIDYKRATRAPLADDHELPVQPGPATAAE
jgi:flagellar protein FlbD